jgi:hypothetical protein
MGRPHSFESADSEERLAGNAPLRRVPATSLMLLRCECYRRSLRQFGGVGAAHTLSMRSRHDRLPNTSGSVPMTGTVGAMSKHSPPTGQSTPHAHSQFAKSTPSRPARGQCDGRGHQELDLPFPRISRIRILHAQTLGPAAPCRILQRDCAIEGATNDTGACTSAYPQPARAGGDRSSPACVMPAATMMPAEDDHAPEPEPTATETSHPKASLGQPAALAPLLRSAALA